LNIRSSVQAPLCEFRRVDVYHTGTAASIDDCAAAGIPRWNPSTINGGSPADDSATWGTLGSPPADSLSASQPTSQCLGIPNIGARRNSSGARPGGLVLCINCEVAFSGERLADLNAQMRSLDCITAGHPQVLYRNVLRPIALLLAWGRCATSQLPFPAPFACR
jgi:hypothetical protein